MAPKAKVETGGARETRPMSWSPPQGPVLHTGPSKTDGFPLDLNTILKGGGRFPEPLQEELRTDPTLIKHFRSLG